MQKVCALLHKSQIGLVKRKYNGADIDITTSVSEFIRLLDDFKYDVALIGVVVSEKTMIKVNSVKNGAELRMLK